MTMPTGSVRSAGIDPDKHLDLQTLGWDKCTAAMEEAISSEKAEPIFQAAADKFQEVAATGGSPLCHCCSTPAASQVRFRHQGRVRCLACVCRGVLTCNRARVATLIQW